MNQPFTHFNPRLRKFFTTAILCSAFVSIYETSSSQCTILPNAIEGISYAYVQINGTNAGGVAYNPNYNFYYAVTAGNPGFPYETFDTAGTNLYYTNPGFDFRGLWWNPILDEVEGNGYSTYGLWTSNLDTNGYALNTGTNLFIGQYQPDAQSCGDFDYDANEIIYYYNGSIYRFDRVTNQLVGSYALTGIPVPISDLNWTSVIYTGCCGNEIGILDYINKAVLLFNKSTGAYSGSSQLPGTATTNYGFNFSYANNLVWLHNTYTHIWTSYSILSGTNAIGSVNLGGDTTLCIGSSLELTVADSSLQYLWSTGSTDTTIIVDTAGIYWVTATNGLCTWSDTIIIGDTLCSPLIAFNSSDTDICEKFCVSFFDSSVNYPVAWQWYFPGGNPSSSTNQNPANICYNIAGTYDVTLITTTAYGFDTLTLTDYVTVYSTPPFPTITQNGYVLTSSPADAYQWQLNSYDIPGATNQSYIVMQTGLYTVIISDEHGCKNSVSQYVLIEGMEDVANAVSFSVSLNPNNGSFMIEFQNAPLNKTVLIKLLNPIGQVLFSSEEKITASHWNKKVDLQNLAGGVYLLEVECEGKNSRSKMVINTSDH